MDTLQLTEKIKKAPVEQIFGAKRMEDLDWLWFHRDLFRDLVLLADEDIEEEDMEGFLRMISDGDFLELMNPRMEESGFVSMSAKQFAKLDPKQKPFDKDTVIFVNRRFLMRKMIGFTSRFEWVLKAMALDMKSYSVRSLREVYKEYFEENGRILEALALNGFVEEDEWKWILEEDTETLKGAFRGKVVSKWSTREADNAFEYRFEEGD